MCVLACINENLLDLSDLSIHVQHEYALHCCIPFVRGSRLAATLRLPAETNIVAC